MRIIRIAPIVEGDGEVIALPVLLRRIAAEILQDTVIDVLRPWHLHRGYVLPAHPAKFEEALQVSAVNLLRHPAPIPDSRILLVMDRDPNPEPTCTLGPRLQDDARARLRPGVGLSCVLADKEFESWFVAAASSLTDHLDFDIEVWAKSVAELTLKGKTWIKTHFKRASYRETVDQVKLTAQMDLSLCRRNSPSFDKLCRELERLP